MIGGRKRFRRCHSGHGSVAFGIAALGLVSAMVAPTHGQIQSGLIGYWKFDGNFNDASPGHRHLVPVGGITLNEGVLGQVVAFANNPSQWVQRPGDDEVYNFDAGDFTISLWVKFAELTQNQTFAEKWVGPSGPGWTFAKHADNSIYFSATGPGTFASPPQSLALGVWNHLVVLRAGDSIQMYRDNVLIAAEYNTYVEPITGNTKPLLLGLSDGGASPLAGHLDELAIWSRALTSAELADLYFEHQMVCNCPTQPSGFAGGDGTPQNPFQVCSPGQLDNVRNHLNSQFVQTADIDLSGWAWDPIGTMSNRFTGVYEGGDFRVMWLAVNVANDLGGLFARTSSTAELKNIHIAFGQVSATSTTGGLVGLSEGLVANCSANATVNGLDDVGGLVGLNVGTVRQSYSTGTVLGRHKVGGLVGETLRLCLKRLFLADSSCIRQEVGSYETPRTHG